jgi:hypothetical protein
MNLSTLLHLFLEEKKFAHEKKNEAAIQYFPLNKYLSAGRKKA